MSARWLYPSSPHKGTHVSFHQFCDAMASALVEHAWTTHTELPNPYPHQHCAIKAWDIRLQPIPMNRETGLLPTAYNKLINRFYPKTQHTPELIYLFHVGTLVLKCCCL